MSDLMVNPASISIPQGQMLSSRANKTAEEVLRVGVIGYGYWAEHRSQPAWTKAVRATMVCDKSAAALARVRKAYPGVADGFGSQRNPALPRD